MVSHYCIANPCWICFPEYKPRFNNEFDNEFLYYQEEVVNNSGYIPGTDKNSSNNSCGSINYSDSTLI